MQYKDYRLAVIMFTNIQGFSGMMEKNEEQTLAMLSFHNDLFHRLAAQHSGTVIKTIGDAFLIDFKTTVDAVKCAVKIQEEIRQYNTTSAFAPIALRIGIHLGDIHFYHEDALGEGINIAAQLQSLAKPGRICISKEVNDQIAGKLDLTVIAVGKAAMKNISKEIFAYEIIPPGEQSARAALGKEPGKENGTPSDTPTNGAPSLSIGDKEMDSKEIKEFVLSQLKKASRRISAHRLKEMLPVKPETIDKILDGLVSQGYLTKLEDENGAITYGVEKTHIWDDAIEDEEFFDFGDMMRRKMARKFRSHSRRHGPFFTPRPRPPGGYRHHRDWGVSEFKLPETWEEYKETVNRQAEKSSVGLGGHAAVFITFNLVIILINFMLNIDFPFFLFPLGAWGIGFVSNIVSALYKKKWKREVNKLPALDKEGMRVYHELRTAKNRLASHAASFVTVNAFLIGTGSAFGVAFPWFFIPALLWGVGLTSHFFSFVARWRINRKKLKEKLKNITPAGRDAIKKKYEGEDEMIIQALELQDSILDQIESFGKGKSLLDVDLKPLLENYCVQIRELSTRLTEIDRIMLSIPAGELGTDILRIKGKIERTASPYMKKEYEKAVKEIERQQQSFTELSDQREIISLRLHSSVNNLRQLKINLARMKGMGEGRTEASLTLLKEKTRELSEYLDDLGQAYREIGE